MKTFITIIAGLAATASAVAIPLQKRGISITPHAEYSSSVGVLGCKINVNRVAYFPGYPSCNSMCIKVSANGRSVNLLHIDQSGGANDIAYDAWNYLKTGQSATADPQMGGGFDATVENAPMSDCANLITSGNGKLAFSAANSMNFIGGCGANSWVGQNNELLNIANPTCNWGVDEVCTLNMAVSNQPSCPSGLGSQQKLTSDPVYNIAYGTGVKSIAV